MGNKLAQLEYHGSVKLAAKLLMGDWGKQGIGQTGNWANRELGKQDTERSRSVEEPSSF